jgi:hypothetical protein
MAILEIGRDGIESIPRATLVGEGIRERADLQRVLLASIGTIMPGVMVITEEFGNWEDSRRRIDILGLDKDANLVVIELKRTEDGGHMELQALRYAAMVSVLTFDQVVETHRQFLESRGSNIDPQEAVLEFLEWEEPDVEQFAQEVRIILVSVEFSKEITTTVLWLNDKGVDISCIRLTPYKLGDRLLVDVQQIIPLPEAEEFQTKVRQKQLTKSASRGGRDLTQFTLTLGDEVLSELRKRRAIHHVFRYLVDRGVSPEAVAEAIAVRKPETILVDFPGAVSEDHVKHHLNERNAGAGRGRFHPKRWFCAEDELIRFNGRTYIVSNQWGHRTEKALQNLAQAFPQFRIGVKPVRGEEGLAGCETR